MGFVKNKKSEHFYERDGTPAYGRNIVTARKVGLWPSMSSLSGLLDKYQLNIWKMKQAALAAIDAAPFDSEEEDRDDYAVRVVNLAQDMMDAAPGLGTDIHDLCAQYIGGEITMELVVEAYEKALRDRKDPNPAIRDDANDAVRKYEVFIPAAEWIDVHVMPWVKEFPPLLEATMVSTELEIGLRLDFYGLIDGIFTLADFKTQDVKKGKVAVYDEWGYQLSGYKKALEEKEFQVPVCMSIVISTASDLHGAVIHVWPADELKEALEITKQLRGLYRLLKGV